jgi:hypothetical protein
MQFKMPHILYLNCTCAWYKNTPTMLTKEKYLAIVETKWAELEKLQAEEDFACRTVRQVRMKRSGQRWVNQGCDNLIKLRIIMKNNRQELIRNVLKTTA